MRDTIVATVVAALLTGAAQPQSLHVPLFENGDRVLFIGDSITHIGKYHVFIADYYATRFPERRIVFLNGGIGGDTVPLVLKRLDLDIAAGKPNKVTVMLGMNDAGGNELYEQPEPEMLRARSAQVDRYRSAFPELIDALRSRGLQVILVAPSPYDETAMIPAPSLHGKNGALEIFADFVRSYGRAKGLPVVDFFAPMMALNASIQAKDRTRTLIGKDRVHPGDEGHLAMAAEFLKAQKAPSLVSNTRVEATYGATSFEFDYQPKALPFPIGDAYLKMDPLIGFTEQFNREMLAIAGLAPGQYSIAMNGVEIGHFDARALSLGINLATNPAATGQKQAQAVSELVHKRAAIQASLRDILWVEMRLRNSGAKPDDVDAARKLIDAANPRLKRFLESRAQAPEMERQVAAIVDEIYLVNRPRPAHIRVAALSGEGAKAACSEQLVEMRDRVKLATNICLPSGPGPWPVVLVRTPYGKDRQFASGELPYTSRLIAFVSQDVRGLYRSEGKYRPFTDDGRDGYDTVEWIARQPWSNGKVGMTGASAPGIIADQAALAAPPHLVCLFVVKAVPGTYRYSSYPGGIFLENATDGWLAGRNIRPSPGPRPRFRDYDDAARSLDMYGQWSKVQAPAYNVAGWYDPFMQGNIDMFAGLRNEGGGRAKGNQKLDINATGHGKLDTVHNLTADAARYQPDAEQRWFDYWLKDIDNGIMNEPAVHYFVMGTNQWKTAGNWPPANTPTKFFLHNDGGMSTSAPAKDTAPATYRYDPGNPVPTAGGNNLSLANGPVDQRPVSARPDVLKFETARLDSPIEVAGPIRADLWVSTSAEDTDFMAKLVDVEPDGYQAILCDGALRLRYREALNRPLPAIPGQPYHIVVEMMSTAMVFQPGHRIAVHITSSNSPKYERHSNTWLPVPSYEQALAARNSIYLDAQHPSAVILPVTRETHHAAP